MPGITPATDLPYRGRFAPSPTGPLHLGSLIAALASYLDARHHRGSWLLRMEDLDPPREEKGAAQRILRSLQYHGLQWDEEVLFQSRRGAAYAAALTQLAAGGHVFSCRCTRQVLGPDGACRGRCATGSAKDSSRPAPPAAARVSVPRECRIRFTDRVQGQQDTALGQTTPDFVIKRKDGLDAYQLAVVVDDAHQRITDIVRGCDLLEPTPRQIFLQQLLGYPTPRYSHLPVLTDSAGRKLSKQNHAPALDDHKPVANLRMALEFLAQPEPPAELQDTDSVLAFAISHWALDSVPGVAAIAATAVSV